MSVTSARADVCNVTADVATVSLSSGAVQRLRLNAPDHPLATVQVLGSFAGTGPGIDEIGMHVPLNLDRYFLLTYGAVSPLLQSDSAGNGGLAELDTLGVATMRVVAPPALHAQWIGHAVRHAFAM